MSFLGLVGIPANAVTYPVYQALKAASPALAAAFAGAEAAAMAAFLAQGAAVVGAGALGWMIGSAIREQLGLDTEEPVTSDFLTAGEDGIRYRVHFTFYNPTAAPISSAVFIQGSFIGVLRKERFDGAAQYYLRQKNPPLDFVIVTFGVVTPDLSRVEITLVERVDTGQPQALRKVPVLPQRSPYTPVRVPTTIPATPTSPSFPITPYVPPIPDTEPEEDNKLDNPGITVKIPELGLQIQYTPTGVRIGQYRDKDTELFTPPKVALPPGTIPPATEPCPCPEPEPDKEVLCRIKRLQKDLLDDGYEAQDHAFGESQSHYVDTGDKKLFDVTVVITQAPANGRQIAYALPVEPVLFAGWFAFAYGNSIGERHPLDYERVTFLSDEKADGFYIACNNGYKATGTYTKYKKKDYVDNC